MAVDLATGNRTIISDASTGSGPPLMGPIGLGLNLALGRAMVTDTILHQVVAVDLATGDRELWSR